MARTGARLKEARLARGTTLQQIAGATKISVPALEAIEREDISRLPGGIFLRSFVRAYATEVGLDANEVVRDFVRLCPEESSLSDVVAVAAAAEATGRRATRGVLALVGVGVVALVAVGAWAAGTSLGWFASPLGPDERLAAEEVPSPPLVTAQDVAGAGSVGPPAPADVVLEQQASPLVVSEPAAASFGPGSPRLAIHPTARCWVRVTIGGVVRFAREMRAGEREEFELTAPILVEVGNAGAFEFSIDDTPGRPLGDVGQVVRARIDPERVGEFLAQ
jgi:cytoskeleton protein RodZ